VGPRRPLRARETAGFRTTRQRAPKRLHGESDAPFATSRELRANPRTQESWWIQSGELDSVRPLNGPHASKGRPPDLRCKHNRFLQRRRKSKNTWSPSEQMNPIYAPVCRPRSRQVAFVASQEKWRPGRFAPAEPADKDWQAPGGSVHRCDLRRLAA
jgi:hypothetical protein